MMNGVLDFPYIICIIKRIFLYFKTFSNVYTSIFVQEILGGIILDYTLHSNIMTLTQDMLTILNVDVKKI